VVRSTLLVHKRTIPIGVLSPLADGNIIGVVTLVAMGSLCA